MADDEETRWTEIHLAQTVDDLIENGPAVSIGVQRIDGGPVTMLLAQIDTGASHTAICPDTARKLGLSRAGKARARDVGHDATVRDVYEARLSLPSGLQIEWYMTGFEFTPPHKALLGRDVLANCRLAVDFTTGITSIHFKVS